MSTTTRVLQRFVLPADGDSDILPLYAEGEIISVAPVTKESRDDDSAEIGIAETSRQSPGQIVSRYSYRVPAQSRSSFGTYFNAFPAAYWRRWTIVEKVTLRVAVSGSGSVIVYCERDPRSRRAVRELRARGIDARYLAGGIRSFVEIGGEVVSGVR